ncbi:mannose-6-phosphate isomerase, class I [Allobranchiibius sp. GilTou73]|uniref:mannose-6-phosphate isomerase, class I n=1 Tax=Allobranchiibius sp. GilTou73 TaxID=2904523 RepID=UPI001F1F81FC|nr:mannose-6-phosphate isomerase, class I [Allobranchiibius sp. GilTou73]UIJ35974.1 mannose-6-phosphate isomerase, class I [Allobranchiibius sp. GilTou73]
MRRLTGRVRSYAWGSHTVLAELTGRSAPTHEPEAELWLGAHEAAPALLDDTTLDQIIAADPARTLGADLAARTGDRLPFLLKVLAPERALSIQCHPDARQALDAAPGTYTDRSPKPEAVVPLTPFEMFAGMVPYDEIVARFGSLGVPELRAIARESLTAHDILAGILATPVDARPDLVERTLAALDGAHTVPADVADAVRSVALDYPGDVGLVVLLTMHHRVEAPGTYVFVPAGVLHAYVRGAAIEILANSDNVVRAGLTPKKIDVAELLRIVQVHRQMVAEVGERVGRVVRYPQSAQEFSLSLVDQGEEPAQVAETGPRIVLALGGSVRVTCDGEALTLCPGQAVFVEAAEGALSFTGTGTAYVAATGRPA